MHLLVERCELTPVAEGDRGDVYGLYRDEVGRRYLGGVVAEGQMAEKFMAMLADVEGVYRVARLKTDGRFVGLFSLDAHHDGVEVELSYQVAAAMRGQGLGFEVAAKMVAYAFEEMGLVKIVAETQLANEASCKLLGKLGMRLEREVERFGAVQGVFGISRA